MHVIRGDSAQMKKAIHPIFEGEVSAHTYVDEHLGQHLRLTLVRFEPGGKTKWHRHAFEQALYIVEGRGILATEKEGEVEVGPGDIVVIPQGEPHWHGATPDQAMAHLSIVTPGETIVLERVRR